MLDSSLKWLGLQFTVTTVVQAAMSLFLKQQDVRSVIDVVAVLFRLSNCEVCKSEINRSSTRALQFVYRSEVGFALPVGPRQRIPNGRNCQLLQKDESFMSSDGWLQRMNDLHI